MPVVASRKTRVIRPSTVAALLGFVATPWVTIGMSLFGIALLALHKRRPLRIRKGDLEATVHHRAPHGHD